MNNRDIERNCIDDKGHRIIYHDFSSNVKSADVLGSILIAIIPPRLMMKNLLNHHI